MVVISILVFAGALALSIAAIVITAGPQWRRIVRLASGRTESAFAPLQELALAERRIAIRRWAAAPVPAPIHRLREAA